MSAGVAVPSSMTLVPNALGVSPVDSDTRLLASLGAELAPTTALDVGTGSGYIAVALALAGVRCTATDVSVAALTQARALAERNACDIDLVRSDLFASVHGRYDLILFNPPFGHSGSAAASRRLEVVKSMVPKEHPVIRRVVFEFVRPARARMIDRFLLQALNHLHPGGSILLLVHRRESRLAAGWRQDVMATDREFVVLRLRPLADAGETTT